MATRKPLLVANWKMHKTVEESRAYVRHFLDLLADRDITADLVICPPATSIWAVDRLLQGTPWATGAQNIDLGQEGPMTGALSGYLLYEAGARYVIVGHSERRQHFGENNQVVAQKAQAAHAAGLCPIICIGEKEDEFLAGRTEAVLAEQLEPVMTALSAAAFSGAVIAYEPIWAIGTGRVPTPEDAARLAGAIRAMIRAVHGPVSDQVRVLYGGSVSPENILDFRRVHEIDGVLVGGASLQAQKFVHLAEAWNA